MGSIQPRRQSVLDPWRDLQVGLATASSLQTSIRHGDTKAATLLMIEGAVAAAAVIDRAASLVPVRDPIVLAFAAALSVLLAIAMTAATWQLVLAMRPRLLGTGNANRFGFPNVVRSGRCPSPTSVQRQRDEAWEFVATLAHIAMAKHRRVRRSVPWLVMSIASAATLVVIATFTAPVAS